MKASNRQSALVLTTEGSEIKLELDTDILLERLQHIVGGYIELVPLESADIRLIERTRRLNFMANARKGARILMVVNEEGTLMELPINPYASALARRTICGNVAICAID